MSRLISIFVLLSCLGIGQAAERELAWPQFRGPGGSGVSEDQKPPVQFGPDKNVKWKVPVPSGLSSPIVVGDLLVITAFEGGKLFTIAYRSTDGKEAWRQEAPVKNLEPYNKTQGSPASSTPATDGVRIVSYFGSCGLICYDLSGKLLWQYDMPPGGPQGDFGSGVSPVIADGLVVLVRDAVKDPRVVALDIATGAVKWEKKRQSTSSFSTPVVWETPTSKQVVMAGHARMLAYDLKDGAEKWSVNAVPSSCCSSPLTAEGLLLFAGTSPGGEGMEMPTYDSFLKDLDKDKDGALDRAEAEKIFEGFFDNQDTNKDGKFTRDEWDAILKFMAEGKNAAFAVKPGGTGDITDSHLLWKSSKGLPYVSSAVACRGQLFMVKDGGIVTALDIKTGKEAYQSRVAASGSYYASPVAANGHVYFVSLDEGIVTVLKAGTDKPEVVAKDIKLGERVAATPAIANDCLYIRTDKHLYAFAEK